MGDMRDLKIMKKYGRYGRFGRGDRILRNIPLLSGAVGTEKERRPPPNEPQYDTSSNFTNLADVGSMQNIFGGTGLVFLVSGKVEERTSVHGPSESLLM